MSYEAIVFNVLIVSPGDVEVERRVVREVIHDWNAIHSAARKLVFQPISWETHSHPSMEDRAQGVLNEQILKDADLLVAIFWTRIGTPTSEAVSGSVEEIERHVETGKPAMIYFSSAPVIPDSVNAEQYRAVKDFEEKCKARGLIVKYDSADDFRQKFMRHLAKKINEDNYFVQRSHPGNLTLAMCPNGAYLILARRRGLCCSTPLKIGTGTSLTGTSSAGFICKPTASSSSSRTTPSLELRGRGL